MILCGEVVELVLVHSGEVADNLVAVLRFTAHGLTRLLLVVVLWLVSIA
jgi:hypothetical protein